MSHLNYTTKNTKGKHLNYEKRIKIEALSKTGMKSEEIALYIGCSGRTVRRELAKGRTKLLNNPGYVNKAPKELVESEKTKLAEEKDLLASLMQE